MRTPSNVNKSLFVYRLPGLSFVLFLSLIILAGCSKKLELNSNWRDREISVDGNSADWLGAMMYIEDANISVGLLNDENFMYVCLIAEDQRLRTQVMRQGFTLWFDPDGGKKKKFGIKYPPGMQASGVPVRKREGEQDLEKFRESSEELMTVLEILGPGKDESKRMPVEEAKGIDINVNATSGMLVYELKISLNRSHEYLYGIGAKGGNSIGIGFETPEIDWDEMRKRRSDRMSGAGRGGGRTGGMRGGFGGRGMRGGGRRAEMPKGIKVWAIVQFASDNSPVSD